MPDPAFELGMPVLDLMELDLAGTRLAVGLGQVVERADVGEDETDYDQDQDDPADAVPLDAARGTARIASRGRSAAGPGGGAAMTSRLRTS